MLTNYPFHFSPFANDRETDCLFQFVDYIGRCGCTSKMYCMLSPSFSLLSDHFSPHKPEGAVNLSFDKGMEVGKMEKFSRMVVNFTITFGLRGPFKCKGEGEWSMASLHHLAFALADLGELWGLDLIGAALNHKL